MSQTLSRTEILNVLTRIQATDVETLAEKVLPSIGNVVVIKNRTGLVMLPYMDSSQGTAFHLGEVLVAEAHIRLSSGEEGYGVVMGRSVVQAMAVAVLDACVGSNLMMDEILPFVEHHAQNLQNEDVELLKQVEATRINMETF